MTTYVFYFLMFLPPAPAQPLYTAEKFADPIVCQMRVNELRETMPRKKFDCMRVAGPIDLSRPAEAGKGVSK